MEELVKKAKAGSSEAYYQLFQDVERDIYKMAFIYVNNKEDALDIVQETAYRSFKTIHTLKEPNYFKTWIIRITINSSLDLLRKNKFILPIKEEQYKQYSPDRERDLPLSITLNDLINKLDENEKSMVILKYYQEFTFKESAELLDIPLGTAKSILYRALAKLRQDLGKEDLHG